MAKYENQTGTVLGAIEEAASAAEELKDELQDWLDGLPENLQSGEKADALQEAISALEEAYDRLQEAQDSDQQAVLDHTIQYSQVVYPKSTYMSRAKRLEVAICGLGGVPSEIPDDLEIPEDEQDDANEVFNAVQEALDTLQSVEFPAMR